jgi:hypothetical protein
MVKINVFFGKKKKPSVVTQITNRNAHLLEIAARYEKTTPAKLLERWFLEEFDAGMPTLKKLAGQTQKRRAA